MKTVGVYTILDIFTGKFYVGSSKNMHRRIQNHWYNLRQNRHHNVYLQELFNENHAFSFIYFPTENRKEAYLLEQSLLTKHAENLLLLNIGLSVIGGDNLTRHPDREVIIEKIRIKSIEMMNGLTKEERKILFGKPGSLNPMYGKTHTAEVRKLISEVSTGNKYCLGLKRSPEQRKFLSEMAKGRIGAKNPFFGRHHSDETKQMLSEKMKSKNWLPTNSRSVSIDGNIYVSVTDAARKLNVSPALIIYRICSKLEKYKCYEYVDNAQRLSNEVY